LHHYRPTLNLSFFVLFFVFAFPFIAAGKLLSKFDGQLPTRLWVAPPTRMDQTQLIAEGYYSTYGKVGARTEMPGCSLCMGNQARVGDKTTVVSTSTRNFPNRLGKGANVFLASAELAAVAAIEGKLPSSEEYLKYADKIHATAKDTYRYMNFDKLQEYADATKDVDLGADYKSTFEKELARLKSL
jgi:aconitate hydratase 2/2-methylisocitrate dehydratase